MSVLWQCETELQCRPALSNHNFQGKGEPDPNVPSAKIPESELPRCHACGGLLRPAVIWFGENLDPEVLSRAQDEVAACDVCLVVGTSSVRICTMVARWL